MKPRFSSRAFTLLEVLLAGAAAAVLLAAIYGLFVRAVKLRDKVSARSIETRLRTHALALLRNDLLNGRVVGTEFNGNLLGGASGPNSSQFPGYLRFTTTTGRDTADYPYGDTQEVEYFIQSDPEAADRSTGALYRTVDRVLLADTRTVTAEEKLVSNVTAMELSFYDGQSWTDTWEATDATAELPQAVRVTLLAAADKEGIVPPPMEVIVPWTIQKP